MKKEVFLKLFYIEDSIVKSIKFINDELTLELITSVNSFAMGNNIRENEFNDCENIYVFKKVKYIDVDKFIKLKNIYHTSIVNNLVCIDTNIGYMYFDFDEVIIK